jgi:hypothetical protein
MATATPSHVGLGSIALIIKGSMAPKKLQLLVISAPLHASRRTARPSRVETDVRRGQYGLRLNPKRQLPDLSFLCVLFQFTVTKGTGFPFLNEQLFHHINQLTILQDLLHDKWMRSPVELAVGKTTFSTHLFAPLHKLLCVSLSDLFFTPCS